MEVRGLATLSSVFYSIPLDFSPPTREGTFDLYLLGSQDCTSSSCCFDRLGVVSLLDGFIYFVDWMGFICSVVPSVIRCVRVS